MPFIADTFGAFSPLARSLLKLLVNRRANVTNVTNVTWDQRIEGLPLPLWPVLLPPLLPLTLPLYPYVEWSNAHPPALHHFFVLACVSTLAVTRNLPSFVFCVTQHNIVVRGIQHTIYTYKYTIYTPYHTPFAFAFCVHREYRFPSSYQGGVWWLYARGIVTSYSTALCLHVEHLESDASEPPPTQQKTGPEHWYLNSSKRLKKKAQPTSPSHQLPNKDRYTILSPFSSLYPLLPCVVPLFRGENEEKRNVVPRFGRKKVALYWSTKKTMEQNKTINADGCVCFRL
jgi:hypothetical protein